MQFPTSEQLHLVADAGLELIPLHQWDAVGKNGRKVGKAPVGKGWRSKPAMTVDEAAAHMAAGGNVGIRIPGDVIVIDVDPRNFADDDNPLRRLAKKFGLDPLATAQTITGSGGHHVFYRLPEQVTKRIAAGKSRIVNQLADYQGIEFKGLGRQVVAPGSLHPDTAEPYALDDDTLNLDTMHIVEAPAEFVAAIVRPVTRSVATVDGEADWTPEMLAEFLTQLDPTEFRDHGRWLELMIACNAATGKLGLDEFATWSTADPQYAHAGSDIAYRWDTFDPDQAGGITVKTLEHLARQHRVDVPRDPQRDFVDTADEDGTMEDEPAGAKTEKPWLAQLNDEYLFVDEGGTIKIYRELFDEELDRWYWARYEPRAFTLKHDDREVETPFCSSRKRMPLGVAWMRWPGRRQADGVAFKPEQPPGILPSGALNLWQGFGVEPSPKGDCSLLYKLIRDALASGNDVSEKYILDWLAYSVQRPHLPAEVALVFRGGKGTGKGTLGRAFYRLFGRHGLHITSPTLLTGRFNEHLRDCVALFADEAFWAGDKQGESILKGLVTEPMITYEGKGTNAKMGRNCIHIIMASNSEWVVPAGVDDERRFSAFDVDPVFRNDKAFFTALHRQLDQGGLGRLLYDLQERDVSDFDPIHDTPATKALGDQKLQGISTTHEHVFVYGVLNGDMATAELHVVTKDGCLVVPKASFKRLCEDARRKVPYLKHNHADQASSQFFRKLKSVTGYRVQSRRGQKELGPNRPPAWVFPPLDVCREMVADLLGYKLEELPIDEMVNEWHQQLEFDED